MAHSTICTFFAHVKKASVASVYPLVALYKFEDRLDNYANLQLILKFC